MVEPEKDKFAIDRLTFETKDAELEWLRQQSRIQEALEKVRSRTMSMKKSSELSEAASTLFQQIYLLGPPPVACAFIIADKEKKSGEIYISADGTVIPQSFTMPYHGEPAQDQIFKSWINGEDFTIIDLQGDALMNHLGFIARNMPVMEMLDPGEGPPPARLALHIIHFKYGFLGINYPEPLEEMIPILHPFAKVFEQTYTRFLDLEQAEILGREARTEAALEKVRSRTLAMISSNEIGDASKVLFDQMEKLSIKAIAGWITLVNVIEDSMTFWVSQGNIALVSNKVFGSDHSNFKSEINAWKKEVPFISIKMQKQDFISVLKRNFNIDIQDNENELNTYVNNFRNKFGFLGISSWQPLSSWEQETIARFSKVFEQTYTRFLDLQKAETQARNAQIEAALERVRSRSMAMHQSNELNDVVAIVYEQIIKLGFSDWGCSIIICDEENETLRYWYAGIDQAQSVEEYKVPLSDHPVVQQQWESWKNGLNNFTIDLEGESKRDYTEFLLNDTDHRNLPEEVKKGWRKFPNTYLHYSVMKYGLLEFVDINPLNSENFPIYGRFAKVFEQTYTRFLDLKKAEAQAKEAQVEAALERIRLRSFAMQSSDEFNEVLATIIKELNIIGVDTQMCSIGIFNKETKGVDWWSYIEGKELPGSYHFPYLGNRWAKEVHEAWLQQKSYHYIELLREEKKELDQLSFEVTDWKYLPEKLKKEMANMMVDKMGVSYISMNCGMLEIVADEPFDEKKVKLLRRFTKVIDLTFTRFTDLKLAQEQAREAQIEAALERVRSRSMAMHHSDEINDLIAKVFEELTSLDLVLTRSVFLIWEPDQKSVRWWMANSETPSEPMNFLIPYHTHPPHLEYIKAWKNRKEKWIYALEGIVKREWDEFLFSKTELSTLPKQVIAGMKAPEKVILTASFSYFGGLSVASLEPLAEKHIKLLIRFTKVFDQTYTRFQDLQKAEVQARKSQIEAALEKVRAQTMAMHNSEDIGKCIVKMFEELTTLGVDVDTRFGIGILNHDNENNELWTTSKEGDEFKMHIGNLDMRLHPLLVSARKAWKDQVPLHRYILKGDDLLNYYKVLNEAPEYPMEISMDKLPDKQYHYGFVFDHGFFYAFCPRELKPELIAIIQRFTYQFAQTYKRYLDLVRAEAQAREGEIQLALERVRARTMAMHDSIELEEVAVLMYREFMNLGFKSVQQCGYAIINEDMEVQDMWLTQFDGNRMSQFSLPLKSDALLDERYRAWKSDLPKFYQKTSKSKFLKHLQKVKSGIDPEQVEIASKNMPDPIHFYNAHFSHGYLHIVASAPLTMDQESILHRFSRVFEQTYTRFLDLQKAESQARESKIELSLERIRAQVTAMQESSDLFDIVVSMRTEFVSLGHLADYFWHMRWLPESYEMSMTSEDGKRIGMVISIPKFVHNDIPGLTEWEKGNGPVYVLSLDPAGAWSYIENMNKYGSYELADPNAPHEEDIHEIGGLTFIMARTTHGEIGFSLPGMVPDPPKEALDTLVRFAGVFDLAYKRFEDLKQAEKDLLEIKFAKQKAEDTLEELKATQAQLIQQEKLASLGQLTAGIAHEIKNPLNFVTNFSELSTELIEEVDEEMKKDPSEIDFDLITELMEDIKSNLKKIQTHGKRADGIVKSMLQHSRGGSGKMEPTDLNELVKEYVNLSFHGMRAGKNPINVSIQFKLDNSIGNIPLIAEDFSRVVLNLCNNAFDAMRSIENPNYNPTLIIRTKKSDNIIAIEVEDNGPGIPDSLKDKILQPFFTTKKGTEGTGLGLSITNDIIKAHGGSLEVKSEPGMGTTFIIHMKKMDS